MKTVAGTGAIKRGFVQLKGGRFLLQGPRFPIRGPRFPIRGHRFPDTGASVPLTGALLNCLIVGHSPDFNCIGPRGASKNIGLGRT